MVYRLYRVRGESYFMILDEVCYPVIHFCRVILSRMVEPSCNQSFVVLSDEYLVPVLSSPVGYGRPLCLPLDGTLLMIRPIHYLFNPSGEGVLTIATSISTTDSDITTTTVVRYFEYYTVFSKNNCRTAVDACQWSAAVPHTT